MTAHTLPLLIGTEVEPMYSAVRTIGPIKTQLVATDERPQVPPTATDSRLGLYKSHVPSMDEGWTRWVLEQEEIPYRSLRDTDVRANGLGTRYGAIVFPDQAPRSIHNGYRAGAMPTEYTGGLGEGGENALRKFVEQGGTLVFLNRASEFAIEHFKLPLRNVVAGVPRAEFYVPGSILRIELDTSHPIANDMPKESIAWAEDSPVFEVVSGHVR